jgi:hypothetical protein
LTSSGEAAAAVVTLRGTRLGVEVARRGVEDFDTSPETLRAVVAEAEKETAYVFVDHANTSIGAQYVR